MKLNRFFLTLTLLLTGIILYAQDGNAGINEANTKVRGYFASGTNLMYAVGACLFSCSGHSDPVIFWSVKTQQSL